MAGDTLNMMETTGTLDRRGSTVEVDRRCQAGVDMQVTGIALVGVVVWASSV